MAIVLIVPMCLLASVSGLLARGLPIDILAQIGSSYLSPCRKTHPDVEFAPQKEEEGAAREAAGTGTHAPPADLDDSFAFILGVPAGSRNGSSAEMRRSLGTAVLFGMLGVTCFGLLFTPAFYTSSHFGRNRKTAE